jgi:kynureninase
VNLSGYQRTGTTGGGRRAPGGRGALRYDGRHPRLPSLAASHPMRPADLYRTPNALAPLYSRFRVDERLLLTGHSHQAWPDRAWDGQLQAATDAALYVDDKWERAFARAARVRRGFAALLDDGEGGYALGASVHELLVRWLSALPLAERPRLVTTDGEFHSLRRQLDRLGEAGIEVVKVPARPAATVAERLAAAVDARTAAALVSWVFFTSGEIVPHLGEVMAACRRVGAELLVDAYHALGALPVSLAGEGLGAAFVVGGGYKYLQMGEGNCFLRVPPGRDLRPVVTGWFAEFEALAAAPEGSAVAYGPGAVAYGPGAAAFAGATYDPTSHYRGAAVMDFFVEQGLTAELLRQVSQHQVGLLARRFDDLDLPPERVDRDRGVPLDRRGGFLALCSPRAGELCQALRRRGVSCDFRGEVLRLGPAPYLADAQLEAAIERLGEAARELGRV